MNDITISGVQLLIFMFVLGTIVGSFLNVVVYRLGTGDGVVRGRSRCFSCNTMLQWYDLIPLASFVLRGGKCGYCGSWISWQYPVVEFVTGMMFLFVGLNMFQNFQFPISNFQSIFSYSIFKLLYFLVVFSILIAVSVYDIRHKIIPNQLVYLFVALSLFEVFIIGNWDLFGNWKLEIGNFGFHIASGFFAWAFFASLWFVSKGKWMGFGDAKLALGMGFLLGPWLAALAVVLSFWIGTLVAVPFTFLRGGGLKTQIPFGPFLAAGCFIAWQWGEQLISFYFSILS